MLYIYTKTPYLFIPCAYLSLFLENIYSINNKFVKDLSKVDIDNDIVITYGVEESKDCYYAGVKKCFLNKPHIYDMLDDKSLCFDFIIRETNIPVIDTFTIKDSNVNELDKFVENNKTDFYIVKEVNSLASHNIITTPRSEIKSVYNNGHFENYIVQPYLDGYSLFNCNSLSVKGEIIEFLIITQENNFRRENMMGINLFKYDRYVLDVNHKYFNRIHQYSQEILKKTNYSGLIDIEFMCKDEEILLLEINPRMSGQIFTFIKRKPIYIDYLILNYIYFLETGKAKNRIKSILDKNDEKYNVKNHNKTLDAYNPTSLFKFSLIVLGVAVVLIIITICLIKATENFSLKNRKLYFKNKPVDVKLFK